MYLLTPTNQRMTTIKTSLGKMQAYLEAPIGKEPNELLERMEYLLIMVAKSGQLLAEAKLAQDQIVNQGLLAAMDEGLDKKLSPSLITKFVNTNAKEVNYLVNWADRVNASATHQLDAIRTIVSYRKAEMNL
jgi:hypothetical protein